MKAKQYSFAALAMRSISMQFKASPGLSPIHQGMAVVHALMWIAGIVTTQMLFDAISRAAAGTAGFADCVPPLLMLAGASFGQQIMSGVWNFTAGVLSGRTVGHIRTLLHRKLQRVDPARFEDTAFLDSLNKAREGVEAVPYVCMILLMLASFYLVYFGLMGAYFFWLQPLLIIALLLAFVPAVLAQMVRVKVFTKLEEQSAPLRREYEYYQKTLCDREYYKETRILGAFRFFQGLFSDALRLFTRKTWKAERKITLLSLLLDLAAFAGMGVSTYILFTATMDGRVSVGAFAAGYAALNQIFSQMQEVVTWHIGNVSNNVGKVNNLIRMLDMPERTGARGTPNFSKGVAAADVTFTYPGREEPAVSGVSLNIADGETVAIVGENGAGKSTLMRLLTGVYRPSEGQVTVGGLDTAETAPSSLYEGTSGVFQKYQRYKMTLEENITISDVQDGVSGGAVTPRIEAALREADVKLDEGIGLDTMLSPEFDGVDLSGGQWQRIAISRGLYRPNGFIVLDEPTSAIDPIEETRIYTQFQRLAKGKCAVVVTHRLGSAKLAHRIIVMDGGRIVDMGTHEELMTRPGKYADMWAAQAQWYERAELVV